MTDTEEYQQMTAALAYNERQAAEIRERLAQQDCDRAYWGPKLRRYEDIIAHWRAELAQATK